MNFLTGKKTFIVAGAMIVWAVAGIFLGKLDLNMAIQTIFTALGLIGIRIGIANQEQQ